MSGTAWADRPDMQTSVAQMILTKFFEALQDDVYPTEDSESVFGIEMDQSGAQSFNVAEWKTGHLMYGAWQTLWKNGMIDMSNMTAAMQRGELPKFFEKTARDLNTKYEEACRVGHGDMYMTAYVQELVKRDFRGIVWDHVVLNNLKHRNPASQSTGSSTQNSTGNPPSNEQQPKVFKGIRINGSKITPEDVVFDSSFSEKVPIAHAVNIPLYVKKLPGPGRNDEQCLIVRLMSEPRVGLAPSRWQYGGFIGPATPVLLARSDGIAFEVDDWCVMDEFGCAMLDGGPRNVKPSDFTSYAEFNNYETANIVLEANYPKGARVRVHGLKSRADLNDQVGTLSGWYGNKRVGVQIGQSNESFSLKPSNVELID
ncbi:hypothetical protein MIR68_002439 [Amoeboaphelidium protococcarum]|nr:hypothetical protein MIR68_002439 [Amoeboaphelidium protococcarum]